MAGDDRKPSYGRDSRPSSGRPSSGRPSSGRPSSGRPSSDRPSSDRPRSDRPRSDRPSAGRPSTRSASSAPRKIVPDDERRIRPRIIEPDIPEEITGEELEKSARAELLSLSADNAKVVARHLVALSIFIDEDPERAHQHGIAASYHAGRLAVVRESAGFAAYRAGHYEIALKELRAAHRISGSVAMWPVMADCERGLGRPLKAIEMSGSPEVKKLDKSEEIEMRIVAAGARRDLGELDAAVLTLTCKELKITSEEWSLRLFYAYADALLSAGRKSEAKEWFSKCADIDEEEITDAAEQVAQL